VNIPRMVSGRTVNNRGVHLQPFGYHNTFMEKADYWIKLLVDTGMSWVTLISAGDAAYKSGILKELLEAGIIPIVRMAYNYPQPWTELDSVEQIVDLYIQYGLAPIFAIGNEPFDDREWVDRKIPPYEEAWGIIAMRWEQAARAIVARGGIAGFPDGPTYSENPFRRIKSTWDLWYSGYAVYLAHLYGKGRPGDYPYDAVSQNGLRLTKERYVAMLDDYGQDPDWNELLKDPAILDKINQQRQEWARPGKTALDDDTCFNGWQKILYYAQEEGSLGIAVPILMTEGGWVPSDRAGSNPTDIRWPKTTPRMVAKKTLQMYNANTPLVAICPWLLACKELGGSGWEYDAWVSGEYADKYGYEKPVIQMLKDNPPNVGGLERVQAILAESLQLLEGVHNASA